MEKEKPILIVGCGPGAPDFLTPAARKAIARAEVLVGASHLLDLFPKHPAERIKVQADIAKILEEIAVRLHRSKIAVLVTGDPGLYSLAQPVLKRFGRESCEVIPGISSLQVAFARLGLDWVNARIIDAHGGNPDIDSAFLAQEEKIAIFAGRAEAIKWVANLVRAIGEGYTIYVCENLTLEGEKIRQVKAEDLKNLAVSPRTIVLLVKKT
ncbi:MAG: precorrin-6y C5,15-methyltransferase (decarboxylating) subunit CbiE [Thermodesulfobacteriota bacterium]|jgi:precorrin-6y C5,15-methyltransferase (decarboxylating) CbiE subunit